MPNSLNTPVVPPITVGDKTIYISFLHVGIAIAVLVAAVVGVRFGLMHSVVVGPGEEAVFVDKPYFWGNTGVRSTPLQLGRKTEFNTTESIIVNVSPITRPFTVHHIPTKDNQQVTVTITTTLRITDSPDMIKKFGIDWYENVIKQNLVKPVREAINGKAYKELTLDSNSMLQIEGNIADDVRQMLQEDAIPAELTDLTVTAIVSANQTN